MNLRRIRRPRLPKRAWRVGAAAALALVVVGGCSSRGVYDMPLPGGADVGDHPYEVKVHFDDVLDLVPNAGVRVNDVPVGRVSTIGLAPGSWDAEVTVLVNGDVRLPANATARLRQSSLLGEKYVELAGPPESQPPVGKLSDGDVIDRASTGRNPEVEEVLGALSMLLNGGGVAQIQNITKELNAALEGRESDVRGLLSNLDELVSGLDAQRDDITRALDSVNRLSARINEQRGSIDTALRDLEPGLRVLNEQRTQLVDMLKALDRLSVVATDVVNRSGDDLVHNLDQLAPVLQQLTAAGENLPKSLEVLLTFPFPDNVVDGIQNSDYVNLYTDVNLNLTDVLQNLGRSRQPLIPLPDAVQNLPLPLTPPAQGTAPPPPPPAEPEKDSGGGLLGSLLGGGR